MQAIKKPIPIEVEEFEPGRLPWPNGVRPEVETSPGRQTTYYVWNELHGAKIPLKAGDFVNVSNAKDLYPITREVFHATYDVL